MRLGERFHDHSTCLTGVFLSYSKEIHPFQMLGVLMSIYIFIFVYIYIFIYIV